STVADMIRARRRVYWSTVWMAAVLVGVKGSYLSMQSPTGVRDFVRSLAAISYRDVAFALVFWAGARAILLVIPGQTKLRSWWSILVLVKAAIAGAYSAGNMLLFGILGGAMTYPLWLATLRAPMLQASIGASMTREVLWLLFALVLGHVALVEASIRIPAPSA